MLLRVVLMGSGTNADPYQCSLPTYRMVRIDYVNRRAIIDVPERDVPQHPAFARRSTSLDYLPDHPDLNNDKDIGAMPSGVILPSPLPETRLPPAALTAWHALLDHRYSELAGRYRPEVI